MIILLNVCQLDYAQIIVRAQLIVGWSEWWKLKLNCLNKIKCLLYISVIKWQFMLWLQMHFNSNPLRILNYIKSFVDSHSCTSYKLCTVEAFMAVTHIIVSHLIIYIYILFNIYQVINFDSPRGGISLVTEKGRLTTSRLLVQKAIQSDSGMYTCAPSNANPTSVRVHILNGKIHFVTLSFPDCGYVRTDIADYGGFLFTLLFLWKFSPVLLSLHVVFSFCLVSW